MGGCKPLSAYLTPRPPGKVAPMKEGEKFGLTAAESALFDSIIQEHIDIIGTEIVYWQMNVDGSIRDPLYGEPAYRKYNGPYRLQVYMAYPDITPTIGQEGFFSEIDSTCYIARAELEKAGISGGPSESDIFQLWKDSPFWQTQAANAGFNVPGGGLYFSVVDVREEGLLFDTPVLMGYNLTVRRTTVQAPERKLSNNL